MRRLAMLAVTALAGCASAPTAGYVEPPYEWAEITARPSEAQMRAVYPAEALARRVSGRVRMICTARGDGAVSDCEAGHRTTPDGWGFEAAAPALAPHYRVGPKLHGVDRASAGERVMVSVDFTPPPYTGPETPTATVGPSSGVGPATPLRWAPMENGADFDRFYPEYARQNEQEGRTVLQCQVRADGAIGGCVVLSETPAGWGFGGAGVRLAERLFRVQTIDGAAVPTGATVRVPVAFMLAG